MAPLSLDGTGGEIPVTPHPYTKVTAERCVSSLAATIESVDERFSDLTLSRSLRCY